jgi:hypothetical protein
MNEEEKNGSFAKVAISISQCLTFPTVKNQTWPLCLLNHEDLPDQTDI